MVRTVLVVDDHAGFRELARALLEEGGYSVVGEATDGVTALAACRRSGALGFVAKAALANSKIGALWEQRCA